MFNALKQQGREDIYGVLLYVFLTIALCLQVLIILAAIFSFIPIKLDASLDSVLPQVLALFRPEREMAFYQLFVILTMITHIAVLALFKNRLQDRGFLKSLEHFLVVEYLWIFLLIFAAFKILIYKEASWPKVLFYVCLGLSVVSKVFWIEVRAVGVQVYAWLIKFSEQPRGVVVLDIACIALVNVLLWIPNFQTALGMILARDGLHHLDIFLVSPALAHLKGAVLNVDAISPLGVIVPVIVGRWAQALGGLTYEHVLCVLVILSMIYCTAGYGFLRKAFGSIGLAMFGTLLFIKLHFFHTSAAPLIWIFPEYTVIRSLFDIGAFYFLWKHSQTGQWMDLVWATVVCGWSMAYMPDTGLYLTLAFYSYVIARGCLSLRRHKVLMFPRDLRRVFLISLLPWLVAAITLVVFVKGAVFSTDFWSNSSEFLNAFWRGIGNVPIEHALKDRQFFALIMGLMIPLFFALSILVIVFSSYIREASANSLWVLPVCLYGLLSHLYYVNRSEATVYYVQAMPLVFVVCFWMAFFLKSLKRNARRVSLLVSVAIAFGALMTNNAFLIYPNVCHGSIIDKKFFKEQTALTTDTQLISRLFKPDEEAAVISSFATKMLMDVSRRPLFYYSPIVVSSSLAGQEFRGTTLYSPERMNRTIRDLETKKPRVVLVEKKMLMLAIPKGYDNNLQSWLLLKNYLLSRYDVSEEGQFLIALIRKP